MSEENNNVESQDNNVDKEKIYLQSVTFDTFLEIVKSVNMIDTLFMYSMPNHIKSYNGQVEKTTQTIFSFYENEDEKWRVVKMRGVEFSVDETSISFGGLKIVDAEMCICVPIINSIILVPGPKSIELGWDVTKIVQFSNMISLTPMVLRMMDMEDEDNPPNHKISISFEVLSK